MLCDQTFHLLYKDRLKKEMEKLDYELRVHDLVETASFRTSFVQHGIFPPFREQENPLSVVGRDYQFLVSLLCYVCCMRYKAV